MTKRANDQILSGDQTSLTIVALDLLDVAWRIAVPVVVLAIAGIYFDNTLGSKPWLTLLGVVIGFGVAGTLVKQQLQKVDRRERNMEAGKKS